MGCYNIMQNHFDSEIAGFWPRLMAYLLDKIIIFLALGFIRIPVFFVWLFSRDSVIFERILFRFTWLDIVLYLLSAGYFVLLTYYKGATLGKKAMKLRVISQEEEKLSFSTVLYRETIGRYLSGFLCLGYIVLAFDERKRGFHDMFSNTLVIYDTGNKGNITNGQGMSKEQDISSWNEPCTSEEQNGMNEQETIAKQMEV